MTVKEEAGKTFAKKEKTLKNGLTQPIKLRELFWMKNCLLQMKVNNCLEKKQTMELNEHSEHQCLLCEALSLNPQQLDQEEVQKFLQQSDTQDRYLKLWGILKVNFQCDWKGLSLNICIVCMAWFMKLSTCLS